MNTLRSRALCSDWRGLRLSRGRSRGSSETSQFAGDYRRFGHCCPNSALAPDARGRYCLVANPGRAAGNGTREPSGPAAGVLLVRDVLAPADRAAGLVVLLHRDVRHEAVGRGAVPVVLARLEEDPVAGPDDLDWASLALAEADALGDEDRLSVGMCVPRGPRTGREVHERRGEGRAPSWRGDGVDVDVAGEPVGRAFLGLDAAARDLHGFSYSVEACGVGATSDAGARA